MQGPNYTFTQPELVAFIQVVNILVELKSNLGITDIEPETTIVKTLNIWPNIPK